MMFGQRTAAKHIEVETLYAMAVEPMRSRILIAEVVVETPRCYRVGRHYGFYLAAGRLHITIEMVGLTHSQSGKELVVPIGVFVHIRIYAEFDTSLDGLERRTACVTQM